jgi:hypothetical protein
MPRILALAPLVFAAALAGCNESSTGPADSVEVVSVTRATFADGFPALLFTVENRGSTTVENLTIDVDARRGGVSVDQAVTAVTGLSAGEQAQAPPVVFANLSSQGDYQCYRYRVRTFDRGGETIVDRTSQEVCS